MSTIFMELVKETSEGSPDSTLTETTGDPVSDMLFDVGEMWVSILKSFFAIPGFEFILVFLGITVLFKILHVGSRASYSVSTSSPTVESTTPAPVISPATTVEPTNVVTETITPTKHWELVLARYQKTIDAWLSYELDVMKIIDYPLMSDTTCEYTAKFHQAMNDAQMYKPDSIPSVPVENSPFFAAVKEMEKAFSAAESYAKKHKWDGLTHEQKQSLTTSKVMVTLAFDESASLTERQSAYKLIRSKLEGIVVLPERAVAVLEKTVRLEITSAA